LGKLPNPELALAMDPPSDSLENSSVLDSAVVSSEAMDLCFNEGDGLCTKIAMKQPPNPPFAILHFKQNITREHIHRNGKLEHAVVLTMPRVVTFQQGFLVRETGSCIFRQVQIDETQLGE
jgi:hypothetical protein